MINSVVLRRVVIKIVVGFEELSSYIKAEQNVRIVCLVKLDTGKEVETRMQKGIV